MSCIRSVLDDSIRERSNTNSPFESIPLTIPLSKVKEEKDNMNEHVDKKNKNKDDVDEYEWVESDFEDDDFEYVNYDDIDVVAVVERITYVSKLSDLSTSSKSLALSCKT